MVDVRDWLKMNQYPSVKFEQHLVSSLATVHLVSRYTSAGKKQTSYFKEIASACQHKSILKCVELRQGISHLTMISELEGCTPLRYYVDKNNVQYNMVCDWLIDILTVITEMNDRFKKVIAKIYGLYVQNGRIRIAPPNITDDNNNLYKLTTWLLKHENIKSKNFGSLALLMAYIGQLSLRNGQTVQRMLKKIVSHIKSDNTIIHLKSRRFIRKNSIEGSRNSQENHPSVANLNLSRCFRKISSSGMLSPYVGLRSPNTRQPTPTQKTHYASPLQHLLKINEKPDNSIRKINRLTLLKRQQHMFQSEKYIKSSYSPERYDAQTDRAKPDSLPSTKALEAKALMDTPLQQKERRPSRVYRKLIIRNPFKDKYEQEYLPRMDYSAIEKLENGADASQYLSTLLLQIQNCCRNV